MERGLSYWFTKGWPRDFHNDFYREMADANPGGRFDERWWEGFLPVLRAWRATRPRGSDFLTSRARERFAALSRVWGESIRPVLARDGEDVRWAEVAPFPELVAEIKNTGSPVFASKFCHFLAPALFPLVDNAAMGNPYPTYAACFEAYRREWLSTEASERVVLTDRLTELIRAPLADGYPLRNKVVELCLIGRYQGPAA
jgi:hypothetical protein